MVVMKMKKCPTCIGIGACGEGDACPTCEGTGEIPTDQVIIDEPCQPIVCLPKSRPSSGTWLADCLGGAPRSEQRGATTVANRWWQPDAQFNCNL